MKILCIGGAGYVGSACLRYLLRRGHDAIALDDLSEGNRAAVPADRLVVADIQDRGALVDVMRREGVEAVMHFAALASVPESVKEPERYYRINVLGTKNVVDAMVAAEVGRIVFSSTAAVYGMDGEMPLREGSRKEPITPYGRTKLAAEWLLRDYARAHDLGVGLLRYFNASGADSDGQHGEDRAHETHLIPLVLSVAAGRRRRLLVYGGDWDTQDGTCVRDYVHVEDLASAHLLCLEALGPGQERIYNLGSGTGTTVLEVLRACEDVAGAPIAHDVVARRTGDPAVLVASSERIRQELGWAPRFADVRDIVETAWRWHSGHPGGYGG